MEWLQSLRHITNVLERQLLLIWFIIFTPGAKRWPHKQTSQFIAFYDCDLLDLRLDFILLLFLCINSFDDFLVPLYSGPQLSCQYIKFTSQQVNQTHNRITNFYDTMLNFMSFQRLSSESNHFPWHFKILLMLICKKLLFHWEQIHTDQHRDPKTHKWPTCRWPTNWIEIVMF